MGSQWGPNGCSAEKNLDQTTLFFHSFIRWSPAKYYYVLEVGISPGQLYRFSPYRGLANSILSFVMDMGS